MYLAWERACVSCRSRFVAALCPAVWFHESRAAVRCRAPRTPCVVCLAAQNQLARLRQLGILQANERGCVSPASLLAEDDASSAVSESTRHVLQFVKGATGVSSDTGARVCLNRLLARVFSNRCVHYWIRTCVNVLCCQFDVRLTFGWCLLGSW
jgi:hypothetical protein